MDNRPTDSAQAPYKDKRDKSNRPTLDTNNLEEEDGRDTEDLM